MNDDEKISIESIGKKKRNKEEINADLKEVNNVSETPIEELGLADLDGIGPITVKKLSNIGIKKVSDLLLRSPTDLVELTGKTRDAIDKLLRTAMDFVQKHQVLEKTTMSGRESLERRQKEIKKLTTGCNALNKFFDGGIETHAITEAYGEFGSGKTQFCHQMTVYAQLPEDAGGLDGNVIYIDTEDTFRPERIIDIVVNREIVPVKPYKKTDIEKGVSKEAVDIEEAYKYLDGIEHVKCFNSFFQGLVIDSLSEKLEKTWSNGKKVKLVVIDSLLGLYRLDYLGRANLSDRQIHISDMINKLDKIKQLYNVAILVTNQVMAQAGISNPYIDPIKAIGGNTVAHAITYRVYFIKSGQKRIAKFIDSPGHAYQEAIFQLSKAGVIDVEEKKE